MTVIERIKRKLDALEENPVSLSRGQRAVRLMSDEELARRAAPALERRASENERVRCIVEEKKKTHPDQWVVESLLQMRKEGLFPDGPKGGL